MSVPAPASSPPATRPPRGLDFARSAIVVAGLFSACVGVVLLVNHFRVPSDDPVKSVALAEAKERLRANPTDEALKQQIRALDLQVRQTYFRHVRLNLVGGWLLVVGAGVFVWAARELRAAAEKPHLPKLQTDDASRQARAAALARRAVAASGGALLLAMLALSLGGRSRLPATTQELEKLWAGAAAQVPPHVAAFLAGQMTNWPRFRGPLGTGVALTTNAPLSWNVTNGQNVLWTAPVPARGHSSPIVWGDRVFLTGGNAKAREVMCFEAASGALLWQKTVPPPPAGFAKEPDVPEDTGWAASTPATDGARVFAIFATGELAALDFAGNVVWSKHLGVPQNMYGHSTSLLVWQDRLIVQFDQGDPDARKSRLYAFDSATGRELWQQPRPVGASWATPVVIEQTNRAQIVALGEPWLMAYDPANGAELWRADCLGADLAPSPVFARGLVVAASPNKHLVAVRADGQGDVTKSHIAWTLEDGVPDITSPLAWGEWVFTLTTGGMLQCAALQTGSRVWEKDLGMDFNASPTLVGDRLYLISLEGVSVVAAAAGEFRELARGYLGEPVHASPAFVGGRVFVRGTKNLFCLGEKS